MDFHTAYEGYPLPAFYDDNLVQDFLRTATLRDAAIFGAFQAADIDESIIQIEDQSAEYLPFALSFLDWLKGNPNPTQVDIAAWIASEFELPVLNYKVQSLAGELVAVIDR